MAKKLRKVLIADDHTIMRDGLEAMLRSTGNFDVVDAVSDGRAAVRAASSLKPDVIIMDLTMPRTGGIEAIARIKRSQPSIKIVALTFHKEDKFIHATLDAGADAYVLKDDSRNELFAAIESVVHNNSYLSPTICKRVVAGYLSGADSDSNEPSWEILTQREREVIKLVAEGNRTRDIATYLSLSPKTIEKHRTNLMRKLNLHSVSALTSYAIANGIITPQ